MDRNTLSHRRADARLRILNPDGTPAANREVRADQRRTAGPRCTPGA